MKQLLLISAAATLLLVACNRPRYYDLTAGEYVNLEKDNRTGKMLNTSTHEPVYMYVDTKTHDTIYGVTGEVINGHIVKTSDGKFKYDGDDEYKIKEEDYKKKVDGDEVKIKNGDAKIKIDDGEKKVRKDD